MFLKKLFTRESMYLSLLVVGVITIKSIVVDYHAIPSESMVPTLEVNDLIIANRLEYGVRVPLTSQYIYRFKSPLRGDVVIFDSPEGDFFNSWIKRVIGVEGDRISFNEKALFINGIEAQCIESVFDREGYNCSEVVGVLKPEHLIRWMHPNGIQGDDFQEIVIPEGKVFVAGDNRNNSRDSRFFGYIDVDTVYGKQVAVIKDSAHISEYLTLLLIVIIIFQDVILKQYKKRKRLSE